MRNARGYILSIFCAVLFVMNSTAQTSAVSSDLESLIRSFYTSPLHQSQEKSLKLSSFQEYLDKLETLKTKKKSDTEFLKSVFFKTHRKYLKHYDPSATFEEMMDTGVYGCLTGTAIYGIILSYFDYDYEIVELTSHAYLKVTLGDRIILMESTLPQRGFLQNVSAITKATEQYEVNSRKTNSIIAISGLDEGNEKGACRRSISLKQLSGLQYYNMAIYNIKDDALEMAFANAKEAMEIYPSQRTEQLMGIVINKILHSKNLTKDLKSGILNTYITQVKKRKLTQRTASN